MPLVRLENLPELTKGKLLALTCERAAIVGKDVGRIELAGRTATLEVAEALAERVVRAWDQNELEGRRVRARVLGSDAPARSIPPAATRPFERLRFLLELERAAERTRFTETLGQASGAALEAQGVALLDLVCKSEGSGVFGRTIATFERRSGELPETRLGPGDLVRLSRKDPLARENPAGVVLERTRARITVAFDDSLPEWTSEGTLRLDRAGDDTTHTRAREALDEVEHATGRTGELRELFFGRLMGAAAEREAALAPRFEPARGPVSFLDASLNGPQREAVALALRARDLALVHGPPGTGKTTTVVEIVRQAVRRGDRVLVTAPSNHAVDHLVVKLVEKGESPVRLGHPARLSPEVRARSLDALLEASDQRALARELVEQAHALRRRLAKRAERGRAFTDEDKEARREVSRLFQDARAQDEVALAAILDGARIVAATCAGAGHEHLRGRRFDLAVLDEASQAQVPIALVPLVKGEKWVLAGDHRQLPPTVISLEAARLGLASTLFEQAIERFPAAGTLLEVQYRMHERIMSFPSAELYAAKLVAHESVRAHVLGDLAGIDASGDEVREPLVFWDTSGMGHEEELAPGTASARNAGEAALVAHRARALLGLGLAPRDLAVIAPYDAQVKLLRELLPIDRLEIDSVDGFQGREKEAVLVSLVRSNERGEVGFLGDPGRAAGDRPSDGVRRLNVAFTRAKRRLEVFGDGATLSSSGFFARFIDYTQAIDAWRSGFEVVGE
jgi:superfamily I DNA and/or RNA helicase